MAQIVTQKVHPGPLSRTYNAQLRRSLKQGLITEIIKKNPAVFRKREKSHKNVILNRLGWIEVIREMPRELQRIERLVQEVREAGTRHLFVLGMGGSSLCPEVFYKVFGPQKWLKSFHVIDTTAPSQLEKILNKVDLSKSFFIVSSKSGTTIETISQFRFFFRLIKDIRPLKAGNFFAAITDAGSDLHRMARRNRFREIFINKSDIGGRYSALSFFGLVPGAFTQADLSDILAQANTFLDQMENGDGENDALTLGTLMGCAATEGIDKLDFRASPKIAPFIMWVEQLVAESTGKEMKGIIPIEGYTGGTLSATTKDRMFVQYALRGDSRAALYRIPAKGLSAPHITIDLTDPHALGVEMLKWEMATVVASTILGVNPFDEPNVAESKRNTSLILKSRRGHRKIIPDPPLLKVGDFTINSASDIKGLKPRQKVTAEDVFEKFLDGIKQGDYLSILCYTEMTPEIEERLSSLRQAFGDKKKAVTLRGYGPRFLHSIGQLYKGGSRKGHFLVLEREYQTDFEIPKMNTSFGKLIKAQAEGDIKALRKRKRPVINVNLKTDPIAGLDRILEMVAD